MIWLLIFCILALLLISAFFSSSETALTAASKARILALETDGDHKAKLVNKLLSNRKKLISSILIGNNLVNILASSLATSLFLSEFGSAGVAYATIAMTILVVIFAEVLPKTYAITKPDETALTFAPILRPIVLALTPFTQAIDWIIIKIFHLFGSDMAEKANLISAHDELRGAIQLHHEEGGVVKNDKDMLGGVLDLKELDVSDVMVHRTKIESLNGDDTAEEIVDQILSSPFTRLPLWQDDSDNIIGVVHAKDLLRELSSLDFDISKLDLQKFASKPWFVPESTGLQDQLNAFLRRKAHFALVVDEYGEVMGLVTLEDILEEIVGEIADEHDLEVSGVHPQPDGSVNVEGSVPIRDLNRHMDWSLPDDEATTIAGLVIHEAQTIPEPGQAFTFYGFRFHVLRKHQNKITSLSVQPLENTNL